MAKVLKITSEKEDKNQANYQTRAINRAFDIVNLFSADVPELSLSDISSKTDLNKSTVIRLLSALMEYRFIEQNPYNDKYHLGIKSFELGMTYYITQLPLSMIVKPQIATLCTKLNLTINAAILDNNEIVYIEIEEPNKAVRISYPIGSRFCIHSTSLGKVLISQFSDEKVTEILKSLEYTRWTDNTLTSPDALLKEVRLARKNGYAEDKQESILGINCVGVPIYDYSGKIVCAISASGTTFEVNEQALPNILEGLKHTAAEISNKLGYQGN